MELTARGQIIAKAKRTGWEVTEYPTALTLKKGGVTLAVLFKSSRQGGGIQAASWQHKAFSGRDMAAQVLRALDS